MKIFRALPLCLLIAVLAFSVHAQDDDEVEIDEDTLAEPVEIEDDEEELSSEDQARQEILERETATGVRDPSNHPGRIVFRKKVKSKDPAVGQVMEVEYQIWNVGDSDVTDVEVTDDSFTPEFFKDPISVKINQDRIAPGKSYTQVVNFIPTKETTKADDGKRRLAPPKATYKSGSEEDAMVLHAEGATERYIDIATSQHYARRVAGHCLDWIIFLGISAPSTLLPYLAAQNTLKKYGKAKQA